MRGKAVVGNWKMYTNAASARQLAADVVKGLGDEDRVIVALCPPFPYLSVVGEAIRGSRVLLGAQNCYHEKEGAFTGEVSPAMLADLGCRFVILGHSERRHKMGESSELVNRKVKAALGCGLIVVLCVGETIEERQANQTQEILASQMTVGLSGVPEADLARVVLAYEPVWAIGTGVNATPQQAEEAHAFLRQRMAGLYSEKTAGLVPFLYGGSVKPDNAATLLQEPNVDGGLIGGASLQADSFLAIVRAALPR